MVSVTQKGYAGPVSNLAQPTSSADMTGELSENGSSSPGGNPLPTSMAKNGKPTSTNGADSSSGSDSGSGMQLTGIAQSPLRWVRKLQRRNAPLLRRNTSIVQHRRHMTFMSAI